MGIYVRPSDHQLGDDQLTVILLGQLLEPARDVHGVADSSEIDRSTVPHLPDDRWARMDAESHLERRIEFLHEHLAQRVEASNDLLGRDQCTAAAVVRPALNPKQRHDTIARKLIGHAPGALDGGADHLAIPVEGEHDIIRQSALGEGRELSDVGEEHSNLPLLPGEIPWPGHAVLSRGRGGEQGHDREVVRRPELQAKRTFGGAPTQLSTRSSSLVVMGSDSTPRVMRTRQVEQRPRPPHTEAWGMPAERLTSRTVSPGGTRTCRPFG